MRISRDRFQQLVNEEFARALRNRKKCLAESPRLADDDDVGGDMRSRCLDCGYEEEDCECDELMDDEMLADDAPGDWRGHCPKCGADEMDCPGHGLGESKKRSKRKLNENSGVQSHVTRMIARLKKAAELATELEQINSQFPGAIEKALENSEPEVGDLEDFISWWKEMDMHVDNGRLWSEGYMSDPLVWDPGTQSWTEDASSDDDF